jgi:hypothetical protein
VNLRPTPGRAVGAKPSRNAAPGRNSGNKKNDLVGNKKVVGAGAPGYNPVKWTVPSPKTDPPLPPAPLFSPVKALALLGLAGLQQLWGMLNGSKVGGTAGAPGAFRSATGTVGAGGWSRITVSNISGEQWLFPWPPPTPFGPYTVTNLSFNCSGAFARRIPSPYLFAASAGVEFVKVQGGEEGVFHSLVPAFGLDTVEFSITVEAISGDPQPPQDFVAVEGDLLGRYPYPIGPEPAAVPEPLPLPPAPSPWPDPPALPSPEELPWIDTPNGVPGAPPGTAPAPGTLAPPDTAPAPLPVPSPGGNPTPAPWPGFYPIPGGLPFPGFGPDGRPLPVQVQPAPVNRPDVIWLPSGPIGGPGVGPRPDLVAIAQELGRLEQKAELQLLDPGPPPVDLEPILERIAQLEDAMEAATAPLSAEFAAGQYELQPPCEFLPDGTLRGPDVAQWPDGAGGLAELSRKIDALADLIQLHKTQRQPTCRRGGVVGEGVTVEFVQV